MTINRLVTWITFLAVFAMAARVSIDTDTWWHLRAGEWIIENQSVPQVDPFSHTRFGKSWQYPGWLVEVPMAYIYLLAGPGALNIFTAAMITLAFIFLWFSLSGGVFLRAFVIIIAATASGVYWAARPYLLTFVLSAVFIWILETYRWHPSATARKRLWLLPLLMILWVNSHGGFLVGFLLFGVYWAAEMLSWWLVGDLRDWIKLLFNQPFHALRRPELHLTWIGVLMLIAVCFNSSGPVMLLYPFKTVSIDALKDYIQEWQSPDFHQRATQPFIWLALTAFAVVGASRRRLALTDFLLFSGFFSMSLFAGRNIALFALVAPLVITRHAAVLLQALSRKAGFRLNGTQPPTLIQKSLNWLILILIVVTVIIKVISIYPREMNEAVFRENLPYEAVAFIQEKQPPGTLLNSYNWGGFLIYALPEYPVFIDGRTDLYSDGLIDEWLQVVRAEEGWQEALDKYQVQLILLEPSMPVIAELDENDWFELYRDEKSVVYGK